MAYCVSITKAGSPSVLKIQDIEIPAPKEGKSVLRFIMQELISQIR